MTRPPYRQPFRAAGMARPLGFALALIVVIGAAGCGSTRYYSWKPRQAGVGGQAQADSPPMPRERRTTRTSGEVTIDDVMEEAHYVATRTVWLAMPSPDGKGVTWVQVAR